MRISVLADILLHWVCIFYPWIIDQHLGHSGKGFLLFLFVSVTETVTSSSPPDPLCVFIRRAASLYVFPGQWQSCSDETWSCKINYDGSAMTHHSFVLTFKFFFLHTRVLEPKLKKGDKKVLNLPSISFKIFFIFQKSVVINFFVLSRLVIHELIPEIFVGLYGVFSSQSNILILVLVPHQIIHFFNIFFCH